MITKITGLLVRLSSTEATLAVGAFEYEVFIPGFVRRQLQSKIGELTMENDFLERALGRLDDPSAKR